jgi:hypothetical protein
MQTITVLSPSAPVASSLSSGAAETLGASAYASYQIIRRNGAVVAFEQCMAPRVQRPPACVKTLTR